MWNIAAQGWFENFADRQPLSNFELDFGVAAEHRVTVAGSRDYPFWMTFAACALFDEAAWSPPLSTVLAHDVDSGGPLLLSAQVSDPISGRCPGSERYITDQS